jgi:hypothetical protein
MGPVGPTWLGELALVEWVLVAVLSVAGAGVLGAGALADAAATEWVALAVTTVLWCSCWGRRCDVVELERR